MSSYFEYAGFLYHIPSFTPVEGQHPAANKERHRRAAREMYEEEQNNERSKKVKKARSE